MADIFVGDIGTIIQLNCGEDVSGATAQEIKVLKPNKQEVIWAATKHATEGDIIEYALQAADIALDGTYKLQAYVDLGTWSGRGETVTLKVLNKFK